MTARPSEHPASAAGSPSSVAAEIHLSAVLRFGHILFFLAVGICGRYAQAFLEGLLMNGTISEMGRFTPFHTRMARGVIMVGHLEICWYSLSLKHPFFREKWTSRCPESERKISSTLCTSVHSMSTYRSPLVANVLPGTPSLHRIVRKCEMKFHFQTNFLPSSAHTHTPTNTDKRTSAIQWP